MKMTKLTKEAIERLVAAPVEVKLWNGCYNTATVKANFARHVYELAVEVTHPLLTWQCGDKSDVSLTFWQSCNGSRMSIPEELQNKIAEMRVAATMQDSEAQAISDSNREAQRETWRAMGVRGF
jgi:hypothetical protein